MQSVMFLQGWQILMYWSCLWKLVQLKHTASQRTTAATHVTRGPSLSNNNKENEEALNVKIEFVLRIFFYFHKIFKKVLK